MFDDDSDDDDSSMFDVLDVDDLYMLRGAMYKHANTLHALITKIEIRLAQANRS